MGAVKAKFVTSIALVAILILPGCGWHLRGSEPLPVQLQSVYLQVKSDNNSFARDLRGALKAIDVTLANAASEVNYQLIVSTPNNKKRILSTTDTARVAEYTLISELTFSVRDPAGKTLISPTRLSTDKIHLFNRENAASAFEEESLLRKEMHRELIQQLIRRYRAITPATIAPSATLAE
jgi:LPS-assembly lipoprotein